jgi:hypothetical protein
LVAEGAGVGDVLFCLGPRFVLNVLILLVDEFDGFDKFELGGPDRIREGGGLGLASLAQVNLTRIGAYGCV